MQILKKRCLGWRLRAPDYRSLPIAAGLTVDHKTTYAYRTAVKFGDHRFMFRPRDSHDLWLVEARLTAQPKAEILWLHDVFSNLVAIIAFLNQCVFKTL